MIRRIRARFALVHARLKLWVIRTCWPADDMTGREDALEDVERRANDWEYQLSSPEKRNTLHRHNAEAMKQSARAMAGPDDEGGVL